LFSQRQICGLSSNDYNVYYNEASTTLPTHPERDEERERERLAKINPSLNVPGRKDIPGFTNILEILTV
jgi:hypothetical protein